MHIEGKDKKQYVQPLIEIEYFEDVDLETNTSSTTSPFYTGDGDWNDSNNDNTF